MIPEIVFTGRNEASDEKEKWSGWIVQRLWCGRLLAGCGAQTEIDDYATNSVDGSDEQGTESSVAGDNTTSTGIPKDEIKVVSFICRIRQREAAIPIHMIWEFRGMQENLDFQTNRPVRLI